MDCWRCRGCRLIFKSSVLTIILSLKEDQPGLYFVKVSPFDLKPKLQMATSTILERLPNEMITYIIEYACENIMRDLTRIRFGPDYTFQKNLNRFVRLQLVCKTFYRLIHNTVLVGGLPIGPRLLDLQMDRFRHYLEGCHNCAHKRRSWEGLTKEMIKEYCGPVWYNPGFFSVFPQLFSDDSCIHEDTLIWIIYQAPIWFEKKLVKNKEYKTSHTLEIPSEEIEFCPGHYKLPCRLPYGRESSLFGTSVIRLRSNWLDVQGDDYWLWYRSHRETSGEMVNDIHYYLVDYRQQTVTCSFGIIWKIDEKIDEIRVWLGPGDADSDYSYSDSD